MSLISSFMDDVNMVNSTHDFSFYFLFWTFMPWEFNFSSKKKRDWIIVMKFELKEYTFSETFLLPSAS